MNQIVTVAIILLNLYVWKIVFHIVCLKQSMTTHKCRPFYLLSDVFLRTVLKLLLQKVYIHLLKFRK